MLFVCIALAEGVRRDKFTRKCKNLFCNFYGVNSITKEILEQYEGVQYIMKICCVVNDEIYKYELMDTRFAIKIYSLL